MPERQNLDDAFVLDNPVVDVVPDASQVESASVGHALASGLRAEMWLRRENLREPARIWMDRANSSRTAPRDFGRLVRHQRAACRSIGADRERLAPIDLVLELFLGLVATW